jgi:hypothetical protein
MIGPRIFHHHQDQRLELGWMLDSNLSIHFVSTYRGRFRTFRGPRPGVDWSVVSAARHDCPVGRRVASGFRFASLDRCRRLGRNSPARYLYGCYSQQLRDPLLWASIQIRVAIALGIVFLMTVKPGLGGALLTIGVAIVLGLASALPGWGHVRLQQARKEN